MGHKAAVGEFTWNLDETRDLGYELLLAFAVFSERFVDFEGNWVRISKWCRKS